MEQLKKDWRIKALFLMGKAMVMRGDFEVAIPVLQKAAQLTGEPSNAEIRGLLETATKGIEKHKRESKKLWSKAFQKRSAQIEPDPEEEAEMAAKKAAAAAAASAAASSAFVPPGSPAATTPIPPVTPLQPAALADLTAQITKDLKSTKSFSKQKPAAASPVNGEKADNWNSSSVAMLGLTAAGLLAAGAFLYLRGKK